MVAGFATFRAVTLDISFSRLDRSMPQSKPRSRTNEKRASDRAHLWSRPGYLIRRLHQIHLALFLEECKEYSVTPVQYSVLAALDGNRVLDQVSLGAEVGLDRTNVADVLARLERRGLLVRRPDPEDARARLASLTPKGKQLVQRMGMPLRRAQERLLAPLSREERDALISMLSTLVQANNAFGRTVLNT